MKKLIIALSVILVATACCKKNNPGPSGNPSSEPEIIPATDMHLDKSSHVMLAGTKTALILTLEPSDANQTPVWESSDEEVATVENGVITAIDGGSATISATIGSLRAECSVKVQNIVNQWKYETGGKTVILDFGASHTSNLLKWDSASDVVKMWSDRPFGIYLLPEGQVKVTAPNEDDTFYVFEEAGKTEAVAYDLLPFVEDDIYTEADYRASGYEKTQYGWALGGQLRLTANSPRQGLAWSEWTILANGRYYQMWPGTYSSYDPVADLENIFITSGKKTLPLMTIDGYGEESDYNNISVDGAVVVVKRGEITFVNKCLYAAERGALAVLCVNDRKGPLYPNMNIYPSGKKAIPLFCISPETSNVIGGDSIEFARLSDPGELAMFQ